MYPNIIFNVRSKKPDGKMTVDDVRSIARENGIKEFKIYTTDRRGSDGGPAPLNLTDFPFQGNNIIIRAYEPARIPSVPDRRIDLSYECVDNPQVIPDFARPRRVFNW
jgi:hypothetical protein